MGLQLLIAGVGRDGTTSAALIARQLFCAAGYPESDARVGHETNYEAFWEAIGERLLKQQDEPAAAVLAGLNVQVEAAVGVAFILPVVRAVFGPDLPILRLVRDEEALILSNVKRTMVRPWFWGGYVDGDRFLIRRPTACDFGEASLETWASWPVHRRVFWYVRKNNALLDRDLTVFSRVTEMPTDALGRRDGVECIARLLNLPVSDEVRAVHSNSGPEPAGWRDALPRLREDLRRWSAEEATADTAPPPLTPSAPRSPGRTGSPG